MIEVDQRTLDSFVLHDVRYSLGRLTWVPRECAERVRKFWPHLSDNMRVIVRRDIAEHVERLRQGSAPYDDADMIRRVWRPLLAWMEAAND